MHYQFNLSRPLRPASGDQHAGQPGVGLAASASTSEVYGDPEVHPQPENYRGCVNPIGIRSCYDEARIAETSASTTSE